MLLVAPCSIRCVFVRPAEDPEQEQRGPNRSERLRKTRRRSRIRVSLGVLVGIAATAIVVSMSPSAAAPPPPAGGYFALSDPGTTFPSESACAERVQRS